MKFAFTFVFVVLQFVVVTHAAAVPGLASAKRGKPNSTPETGCFDSVRTAVAYPNIDMPVGATVDEPGPLAAF
jgi:hypothetical protein